MKNTDFVRNLVFSARAMNPNPTPVDFSRAMARHFDAILRIFPTISGVGEADVVRLKEVQGAIRGFIPKLPMGLKIFVSNSDRKDFLDSLCDQMVTGPGCCYMKALTVAETGWQAAPKDAMPIIASIEEWFRISVPEPQQRNFTTQLGVHFEEFHEMLVEITGENFEDQKAVDDLGDVIHRFATDLKDGLIGIAVEDHANFRASFARQLETVSELAYVLDLDIIGGIVEVDNSNYSKFENGKPILHPETRKVMKGRDYFKPDLEPFTSGLWGKMASGTYLVA